MVVINPMAHAIAATIVGKETDELDKVANKLLQRVIVTASKHRKTGAYIRSLKVVVASDRHGKDRFVVADDPAAVSIEFGHWAYTKRGRRVSAVRVPGLRIMRDTYAKVRRRV